MPRKPDSPPQPRRSGADKGQTLPSRHQQPEPRLPHEHGESSDSHPGTQDPRIEQAARDVESGQEDTGRHPVVTELARVHFPPKGAPIEKPPQKTAQPARRTASDN